MYAYAAAEKTTDTLVPDGWPTGWLECPGTVPPPGWGFITTTQYTDVAGNETVQRHAVGQVEVATKALAVADGAAKLAAATPAANDEGYYATFSWPYHQRDNDPPNEDWLYSCSGSLAAIRDFWQFTVPADAAKVFVVAQGIYANSYGVLTYGYEGTVNPAWNHTFYLSTTSPGTLGSATWDFGSLAATVAAQSNVGQDSTSGQAIELKLGGVSLTAGTTYYMQHRMDESTPTFLTGVTWPTWNSSGFMAKQITGPSAGTIAYGAITTLVYLAG